MHAKPTETLLRSKDYIAAEDEAEVLEKLKAASRCPYHKWCSPELIGPKRMLPVLAGEEGCTSWDDWHLESKLYVMFKDAMLFPRTNWICFCPECASKNPTPGKHNKFGYGFCSQHSWRATLRGWESACDQTRKKQIKEYLKTGNFA